MITSIPTMGNTDFMMGKILEIPVEDIGRLQNITTNYDLYIYLYELIEFNWDTNSNPVSINNLT